MLREPLFDKSSVARPVAAPAHARDRNVAFVLTAFGFSIALSMLVFFDAWRGMARVWMNSETYTHGFIAVPFAAWMMWRNRSDWSVCRPGLWWPGLLVVAGCMLLWILGRLAGVASLEEFGAVALIPAAMAVLTGVPVVSALAFPLAFLFFAVPVGDFLTPLMMDYTADATVAALQWTGVPVYREGLHFTVPSGRWSVVEACSGLRYLIASLALGVLYAYLQFRTLKYRLAFMALSLVVPIIANWVRAYLIVMLGHLSNMQLAAGADHLIYGWVFFGLVMALLFWIGSRWREPIPPTGADAAATSLARPEPTAPTLPASRPLALAALAAVALALLARPVALGLLGATTPVAIEAPIESALAPLSGGAQAAASAAWAPVYTEANASERFLLNVEGRPVQAHVAYYARQYEGKEMIHHDHHVVRHTDREWPVREQSMREAGWGRVAEYRIGLPGQELLVWHWYQVAGVATASEYAAKAATALALLSGRGDHSLSLVLATPVDRESAGGLPAARRALETAGSRLAPAADLLSRGQVGE
jgi:exosortase A